MTEEHRCDAVVVRCMDYRLQELIAVLLEDIQVNTYDVVSLAGATKDHTTVVKQIKLSVELHHTKRVILIHHEDCGAYGNVALEKHTQAMLTLKSLIERLHLGVTVECYFLCLNGSYISIPEPK